SSARVHRQLHRRPVLNCLQRQDRAAPISAAGVLRRTATATPTTPAAATAATAAATADTTPSASAVATRSNRKAAVAGVDLGRCQPQTNHSTRRRVADAVRKLGADPQRHLELVSNGALRAPDFCCDAFGFPDDQPASIVLARTQNFD